MSSEPIPSPSTQPPVDSTDAAAPLKPLLNPLQTDGPPPASTVAEPPRSPDPQNPAVDGAGNNVEMDMPSASASVVGPGEPVEAVEAVEEIEEAKAADPTPNPSREDTAPPPLPTDAPVPPTPPQPTDEAPPVLPPGAIPPAVSTPTVITTEEPPAPIPTPPPEQSAPAAAPAPVQQPNGVSPVPPVTEAMDIDPKEEAVVSPAPGMESRASEGSLKRAGDDLEGREEKRIKEASPVAPVIAAVPPAPAPVASAPPVQASPAPIAQPAPAAALPPLDPNAPPLPWTVYVEPAPKPAGPTTPLTQVQHRHMLQSVRALKKAKDAVNFLEPVNVVLFNIPHYAQIITKPMDLGTVEHKLLASDPRGPPKDKSKLAKWEESKGTYKSVSEVVADVRQIWENTRKFNGPAHVVSQMASKLDDMFERQLKNLPAEPLAPPTPIASSPAAGPSARRQSISQAPAIRRSSDGPDSRPKREIHPPPSKDLGYSDGSARKPKRRNDPQVQWAARTIKSLETTQKFYDTVSPFLYPVEDIIAAIPDYARLIKQPIDLLKIKARLEAGEYDDFQQVDADMRLMIRNAKTFNPPQEPVHQCAVQLASIWDEKIKSMPAKQEARDLSEDPLADDFIDDASDEEDAEQITKLERQVASLQQQIAEIRTRRAARKSRPKKSKKPLQRKQSMPKTSPGFGTNGHAKKPRKSRDVVYKDDDEAESEDDINGQITLAQKQELADKMGMADGETLQKAITIIQQTQDLGSNNDEIELDIDSLPARTVLKLYNLVVRGRKTGRSKAGAKKTGRKATGGANRKFMNEDEEAERIRKMEEKLNTYEGAQNDRRGGFGNGNEYDEADEESSEEESSDDE